MAQVHNKVNAGIMDGICFGGGMMEESEERFETWYRGYNAKYGSDHNHLLWLTDDIDYARTYGNRVEEVVLDNTKMNPVSLYDIVDYVDYLNGPSIETCAELSADGYNCYFFDANTDGSYCMCLWDKSMIVSRRELGRKEFEKIGDYEIFGFAGYNDDLNESTEYDTDDTTLNDIIHSDNFKSWFGDWENDPNNASKAVDENGRPLVVHHGSPKFIGNKFNKGFVSRSANYGEEGVFCTTQDKEWAERFSYPAYQGSIPGVTVKLDKTKPGDILSGFLNLRHPLDLQHLTKNDLENIWKMTVEQMHSVGMKKWGSEEDHEEWLNTMKRLLSIPNHQMIKFNIGKGGTVPFGNLLKKYGYDGFIARMDTTGTALEYCFLHPNQFKSIKSIAFSKESESFLDEDTDLLNETTDSVPLLNLRMTDSNSYPFITFKKKDGTDTETFVGEAGEEHNTMPMKLITDKKINKEDFGESLWDIRRNEFKSGRIWFMDNMVVASFYSYSRDNYKKMYHEISDTLSIVRNEIGETFDIGKVVIDFWTFPKGEHNKVFIPVEWLKDGFADMFFKFMKACVPFGDDTYNLMTNKGNFTIDWRGNIVKDEINESKNVIDRSDYQRYIKSIIDFLRNQHLNIDPLPDIELNNDEQEGLYIKTGYYLPDEKKVVIFTNGRHIKDCLRSFVHEMVHHMQNLQNPDKDWGGGGDLEEDGKLRNIEGEAFLLGNILFREWTEKMKKTNELNESKKRKKQVKNDNGEVVPEICDKCGGKVVVQIHGEPVYVCKDCGKYFGTMPFSDSLNEITSEIVEPDDVDLSSFNIKKHLNPKFWDDGHLDTRIRLKLLDIADDFFESLDVDWVEPEDIIITGSLANYNWNKKYSDIDLHIVIDYEDVDERVDFVREYFTLKKNEWNRKHEGLKIYGFPVEVYVQDTNEPHASSGVYSIDRDEWITEPDRDRILSGKVNKKRVREIISTYMNKIDCLIDIYKHHRDDKYEMERVSSDASEMLDEIKKLRKDDLAKYGKEMCDGNIIFKSLRRSDYIGKLIKLKNLAYNKINSI